MSAPTLRRALLRRLPARDEEDGSIPMLMLVIISTITLGAIMLTMVLNQTRTTRFDQTRVHALHAAQTGIDIVLGQVRDATTTDTTAGTTTGDDGQLPCGPWSGRADANNATYSTTITYYYAQPLTDVNNKMTCTSAGPYYAAKATRTPHYALIRSTGLDGSGGGASSGRTLETTYIFNVSDVNVAGGTIMIYPSSSAHYCMDAGSATPTTGTVVVVQLCSTATPPIAQQVWAYRADLSIELVSTSALTTPLCIDTGANPTAHAGGNQMLLEPCKVSDVATWCGVGVTPTDYAAAHSGQACVASPMCPPGKTPAAFAASPPQPGQTCTVSPWNQQWSVDDNAHLRGAATDQTNTDGYCINDPAQTTGSALGLTACAGGTQDTAQTWVPSPTAGAGMAGAGNQQLVNYQQFATCLDVTGQDVNASYLILYTCKQNPDPAKVLWNQKFTPSPTVGTTPATVLLKTTANGTTYCLRSPLTAGGFPVMSSSCPATATNNTAGFAWTVRANEQKYSDRYTIRDSNGLCLSLGPNSDLYISAYYKAIVANCTGGTEQKWNAAPTPLGASLTNTHEVPSGGS